MAVRLQIAKFKLHQQKYLPNLILAKVTCYTVQMEPMHTIAELAGRINQALNYNIHVFPDLMVR